MRHLVTVAALVVMSASAACGPADHAPVFDPIDNATGFVGQELDINLRASDANGNTLYYSFSSPQIPDLDTRAAIRPYGDGSMAIFAWTPNVSDIGTWEIDFNVTDGSSSATETVDVEIDSAEVGANAPVFVQPLGTGTTLDLSMATCIDVDITVNDNDTPQVTIALEPQIIAGGTLTSTGHHSATRHWSPSPAQIAAENRYDLVLSASDGTNPKTIKTYHNVLEKPVMMGCGDTGTPPVVTSSTADDEQHIPLAGHRHGHRRQGDQGRAHLLLHDHRAGHAAQPGDHDARQHDVDLGQRP